jgi:alcohol dehydrogenase
MAHLFRIPNVIVTGAGAHEAIPRQAELFGKKHALIVTDHVKIDTPIERKIIETLQAMDIATMEFSDVRDRVSHRVVNAATDEARDFNVDLVVAIGGRQAMHVGRLVAMLLRNGGRIEEYQSADRITKPSMTSVVVATTASTGVAISTCVCYTNEDTGKRFCFADPRLLPSVAILDPGLTNWLSPQDIALDGVASLGYAVEAMFSTMATPVTDACAREAITAMVRWLPEAYAHSHMLEYRERLMFAQQLVSMASSNVMANFICKLSGQIESQTHIPMGNAVAALMPNVVDMLADQAPDKLNMLCTAILHGDQTLESGEDQRIMAADELRSIIQRLDMPLQLSFLGFEEKHIGLLLDSMDERTLFTSAPIPTDEKSLEKLLRTVL